jgi:hypothetical protein
MRNVDERLASDYLKETDRIMPFQSNHVKQFVQRKETESNQEKFAIDSKR